MNWMVDLCMENVIFEVDCEAILKAILKPIKGYLDFHYIISKCKDYLSNHTNSLVSFKRKQTNQVAHTLARASRFFTSIHIFHYISSCIVPLIMNESNFFS